VTPVVGSQAEEVGAQRARSAEDILADVLAFFVAQKKYSYVDILGNALDKLLAMDVVKDAIRDFESACLDGQPIEEAICPNITAEELEKAGNVITSRIEKASTQEFLMLTRKLAVRALARAPKFKKGKGEEGGESSG